MEFKKFEYDSVDEVFSSQESNSSLSSSVYSQSGSCFSNCTSTNLSYLSPYAILDPQSYSPADTTGQLNNLANCPQSFPYYSYANLPFVCSSQNSNIENECSHAAYSGINSGNSHDFRGFNSSTPNNTSVEAPITIRPANSCINNVTSMQILSPISGNVFNDNSNNFTESKTNNTMTSSELQQKLSQKRERNRIAARKCRDKKLNKIKEYEDKIAILQSEVKEEEREVAKLSEYKNRLRRLLLAYLLQNYNNIKSE